MSQYRENAPKPAKDEFRFEDGLIIERLLKSKKLTDKQREALRRLLASYKYMRD